MNTLERIKAEYEEHLRANWNVDGERKSDPSNMYVMVTPNGEQVSSPFDITKPLLIPLDMDNTNSRIGDLRATPSPEWESLNRCKQ